MSNNQKQRSATERLNDLEQGVMGIFQAIDNMSRDLMLVKDAIKLLGNKTDAIARASNLSDDVISGLMVENNIAELKGIVDRLVNQGVFVAEEVVTAQSFVVIREVDDAGNTVNPRIQLAVGSIEPTTAAKLVGARVGETVEVAEGKLKAVIVESYEIVTPQAPQAELAEAPAAEQASS